MANSLTRPLSQRDLSIITESFATTLRVTYHPRLEYPQDQPAQPQPAAAEIPITPSATMEEKTK